MNIRHLLLFLQATVTHAVGAGTATVEAEGATREEGAGVTAEEVEAAAMVTVAEEATLAGVEAVTRAVEEEVSLVRLSCDLQHPFLRAVLSTAYLARHYLMYRAFFPCVRLLQRWRRRRTLLDPCGPSEDRSRSGSDHVREIAQDRRLQAAKFR